MVFFLFGIVLAAELLPNYCYSHQFYGFNSRGASRLSTKSKNEEKNTAQWPTIFDISIEKLGMEWHWQHLHAYKMKQLGQYNWNKRWCIYWNAIRLLSEDQFSVFHRNIVNITFMIRIQLLSTFQCKCLWTINFHKMMHIRSRTWVQKVSNSFWLVGQRNRTFWSGFHTNCKLFILVYHMAHWACYQIQTCLRSQFTI